MRARGQRGDGEIGLILGAVLVAGAIAAAGFAMMSRTQTDDTEQALHAVDQANDVSVQSTLTSAMGDAQIYFADKQTFVGYSPAVAEQSEPTTKYNDGDAVPGQVSIRGITATSLVLVMPSQSGSTLCAANNAGVVVHGRQDATTAAGCTGGW
jgi:hypothetical protein